MDWLPPDHLRLPDADEPDLVNVPKTLTLPPHLRLTGAHLRPPDAVTVITEHVSGHESRDVLLSQKEDAGAAENVDTQPFISVPQAQMEQMERNVGADIPECGECGQPWTTDVERHRTSVRRGLRNIICDACREEQVAVAAARQGLG